jgi:hypothetical protein
MQRSAIGTLECFAQSASQMDIGRGDSPGIRLFVNLHDALQWMFSFFVLLMMSQ